MTSSFQVKKENESLGFISLHVDDFLYDGTKQIRNENISAIKTAFETGKKLTCPLKR